MYRPQLNAISTPLQASIHARRGCANAARNQPGPCFRSSQPQTNTALHAIRCSTICSEGTDLSRCQYSGIRPQTTKEAAATQRPAVVSRRFKDMDTVRNKRSAEASDVSRESVEASGSGLGRDCF